MADAHARFAVHGLLMMTAFNLDWTCTRLSKHNGSRKRLHEDTEFVSFSDDGDAVREEGHRSLGVKFLQ